MATAHITPDHDAVVTEVFVAAPLERVFQAIVDREQACSGEPIQSSRLLNGNWIRGSAGSGPLCPSNKAAHASMNIMAKSWRLLRRDCLFTPGSPTGTSCPRIRPSCAGISRPRQVEPGSRLHTAASPNCQTRVKRTARAGPVWSRASKRLSRSECFVKGIYILQGEDCAQPLLSYRAQHHRR